MDPNFDIPKNRKRLNVLRLSLIMGVTALLFLAVIGAFGAVGTVIVAR